MQNIANIIHANKGRLGKFSFNGYLEEAIFLDLTINNLTEIKSNLIQTAALDFCNDYTKTMSLAEGINQVALEGKIKEEIYQEQRITYEDIFSANAYLQFIKNKKLAKYARSITDLRALTLVDLLETKYKTQFQGSIQQHAINLAKISYKTRRKRLNKLTIEELKGYRYYLKQTKNPDDIFTIQQRIQKIDTTLSNTVKRLQEQIQNQIQNKLNKQILPLDRQLAYLQNKAKHKHVNEQEVKCLLNSYKILRNEEGINQCQNLIRRLQEKPMPRTLGQVLLQALHIPA